MRALQFRIWSYQNKKMFNGTRSETLQKLCLHLEDVQYKPSSTSDMEIMQSCGFKDTNNKELYEGDICKGKLKVGCMIGNPENGCIIYNNHEGRYEWQTQQAAVPLNMVDGIKHIGNQFENPELIDLADKT